MIRRNQAFEEVTKLVEEISKGYKDYTENIKLRSQELVEKFYSLKPHWHHTPSGVAQAAVYRSCFEDGIRITQKQIAKIGGRSLSSLKSAYSEMKRENIF